MPTTGWTREPGRDPGAGLGRTLDRGIGGRVLRTAFLGLTWFLFATAAEAGIEAVEGGIRFSYTDARAKEVFVTGSFANWNAAAHAMTKSGDVWTVTVKLEPGEHEYKFVVDGQWVADPDNPATVGEYGNSAVSVTADGALAQLQATSNTTLSPKIFVDGRAIALYEYREDADQDRFELDRPSLDFDINFDIRINSDLRAHVLTNVNNEAENVEFYQTRLNFDRGSLTLDNATIFLQAWDNEGVETWDDPLHLVGDVGIYNRRFGYGKMGMRASKEIAGFRAEMLYADDESEGPSGHPVLGGEALLDGLEFDGDAGVFRIAREAIDYQYFDTFHQEDVFAARVARDLDEEVGRPLSLQGLFRLDRGTRPGAVSVLDVDPAGATGTTGTLRSFERSFENWLGGGGAVRFGVRPDLVLTGEFLRGRAWIDALDGTGTSVEIGTVTPPDDENPNGEAEITPRGDAVVLGNDDLDLDTSSRFQLGVRWSGAPLGLSVGGSWEYQDHELTPFATGLIRMLKNDVSVYRIDAAREWERFPGLDRFVRASLDLEYSDFSYDPLTPWEAQFWFADRNFWLDAGADRVSLERLTLLGGRDAVLWSPDLFVRIHEAREVDFTYRGTLGSEGLDKKPKYFESIFQTGFRLTRNWRLGFDHRLVRYDAPALELKKTFNSSFVELAFEPAEGVSLALSWGVDPYVIDGPTNEYDSVGRDEFVFAAGADSRAARDGYLELGRSLQAAEEQLSEENRFQFEARLVF